MARYLIDTNVLLRIALNTSAQHAVAVDAIAVLLGRGDEVYLAPQVLTEFWCVATRPADVNGLGWPVEVVRGEIESLLEHFPLLPETPTVFDEWLHLVIRHNVIGKQVHDTRLVAILNTHQVDQLVTFNTGDFKLYNHIAVSPNDIMVH